MPLQISERLARDPGGTRLWIVLSRTELPELATIATTIAPDETRARDIQGLLNRLRSANESAPVIVEEQPDKTIHFVSNAPTQIAPLVIEFAVAPR